jgi:hypothetical protein
MFSFGFFSFAERKEGRNRPHSSLNFNHTFIIKSTVTDTPQQSGERVLAIALQ